MHILIVYNLCILIIAFLTRFCKSQEKDKDYIAKKFNITREELDNYLSLPSQNL